MKLRTTVFLWVLILVVVIVGSQMRQRVASAGSAALAA